MANKAHIRHDNIDFVDRFKEACGTSRPAEIQRLLNVSYQAAKNYLQGRLPDTAVLQRIAERTPYSLHWLLTGRGERFVGQSVNLNTPPLTDQIRDLVRAECAEMVTTMLADRNDQPRIVVLESDKIRSEKATIAAGVEADLPDAT